MATNVIQNPRVNTVNHQVRPQCPVGVRIHVKFIPGIAAQPCPPVRQFFQNKFTAGTAQSAIQVWWMHMPPR